MRLTRLLALVLLAGGALVHPATARTVCAAAMSDLGARELALLDTAVLTCLAEARFPRAQLELARRLELGHGLAADPAKAADWYSRAAGMVPPNKPVPVPVAMAGGQWLMGHAPEEIIGPASETARYRLGQLYVEGRGVKARPAFGRKLMEMAIRRGYKPAS